MVFLLLINTSHGVFFKKSSKETYKEKLSSSVSFLTPNFQTLLFSVVIVVSSVSLNNTLYPLLLWFRVTSMAHFAAVV